MQGDSAMIKAADTAAIAVIGVKLLGTAFASLSGLLPRDPLLGGVCTLLLYLLRLGLPLVFCLYMVQPVHPRARRSLPFWDGLAYSLAAVGLGLCANRLSTGLVHVLEDIGFSLSSAQPDFSAGGAALVVELLAWTLFPALLEELFFRGALYGLLSPYGERRAVLLCALLFALCHSTVGQLLPAFVMGVLLGWLRAASGSVLWPMAAHLLYNGVAAAVMLVGGAEFATVLFGIFALVVVIVRSGTLPELSSAASGSFRRSFWLWAALVVTVVDALAGISIG